MAIFFKKSSIYLLNDFFFEKVPPIYWMNIFKKVSNLFIEWPFLNQFSLAY